jgi:hypothetical protein
MSMQSMPVDKEKLKTDLSAGDKVEVGRSDGQNLSFSVTSVDEQGIHGSGVHVPFNEIKSVSREEVSWWRTGLIGLGIAGVVVLLTSSKGGSGGSGGGGGGGW